MLVNCGTTITKRDEGKTQKGGRREKVPRACPASLNLFVSE